MWATRRQSYALSFLIELDDHGDIYLKTSTSWNFFDWLDANSQSHFWAHFVPPANRVSARDSHKSFSTSEKWHKWKYSGVGEESKLVLSVWAGDGIQKKLMRIKINQGFWILVVQELDKNINFNINFFKYKFLTSPVLFWSPVSRVLLFPGTSCPCDCLPVPDWFHLCPITCAFPVSLNPVCLVPRCWFV